MSFQPKQPKKKTLNTSSKSILDSKNPKNTKGNEKKENPKKGAEPFDKKYNPRFKKPSTKAELEKKTSKSSTPLRVVETGKKPFTKTNGKSVQNKKDEYKSSKSISNFTKKN
jgi:hypothetical protein